MWEQLEHKTVKAYDGVYVGHDQISFSSSVSRKMKGWEGMTIEFNRGQKKIRLTRKAGAHSFRSRYSVTAKLVTKNMPLGRYLLIEEVGDSLMFAMLDSRNENPPTATKGQAEDEKLSEQEKGQLVRKSKRGVQGGGAE